MHPGLPTFLLGEHTGLGAFVVLLAGFLARVWAASWTFLNADEALHFRLANQASLAAVYQASLTESHPPLLYWLLYCERGLAASELWLRMPSVIAGTVFCWIFFRWLTQVTGRVSGFVGLMLVALLPPIVRSSAEVRQYALLLAFLAGALYFLERALAEDSWQPMVAASVCIYLAMLSHYSALFFVAGLGVYALMKILQHRTTRPPGMVVAVWVAGQLGAVALLVFLYKTHLSHLGQGESRTVLQGWMSEFYLSRSYFEPGRDNPLLFAIGHSFGVFQFVFGQLAVGDLAGLLFLMAAGLLWRGQGEAKAESRPLAVLLVLLFAVACSASLAHVYPYGGTRHTAYLIIPAVAGVSFAVGRLTGGRWTQGVALGLLILIICIVFGQQHQPYMARSDQTRREMNSAMAFLRQNVAPGGLIFTDFESSLILGHYLCEQKPVAVQASTSQFETFSCGGYRVVTANRRTATYFFPEIFFNLWKPLLETYTVKVGDPVWIFQAGWGVNLPEQLRGQSAAFRDLPFRAFGNNIKIFKLTAGPDLAESTRTAKAN
jgi:hypothetical protein